MAAFRRRASPRASATALLGAILVVCAVLSGCAFSTQLTPTQPAGITQQLLMRSLERALARLDLAPFTGKRVSLEVHTQTGNDAFVKAFVETWLAAHAVRVAGDAPALKLRAFVSVLGTDRNERLIGIPSFQVPALGIPVPEIALFKLVRNRGQAEVSLYAFDGSTGDFVQSTPTAVGHAKQNDYTFLLVISFTLSDVDEREK